MIGSPPAQGGGGAAPGAAARDTPAIAPVCGHLDQIKLVPRESYEGCEDCLKTGDTWLHLRVCLTCGHVGCCDSSPNQHASRHAREARHAIVRSAERGEEWCWCYVDEKAFVVDFESAS